jgi:hypothetical protein
MPEDCYQIRQQSISERSTSTNDRLTGRTGGAPQTIEGIAQHMTSTSPYPPVLELDRDGNKYDQRERMPDEKEVGEGKGADLDPQRTGSFLHQHRKKQSSVGSSRSSTLGRNVNGVSRPKWIRAD